MSLTRGQHSISDLLEMDASGKKSVIPYICLVEAENTDTYLHKAKCEFFNEPQRIAAFLTWATKKRRTVYTLHKVLQDNLSYDLRESEDAITATVLSIIYYYLINVEKEVNIKVKLNLREGGVVSLLQAKVGNVILTSNEEILELFDAKVIDAMTMKLLSRYEYEDKIKATTSVPDTFTKFELLLHDFLLIEGVRIQKEFNEDTINAANVKVSKLEKQVSKFRDRVNLLEARIRKEDTAHKQNEVKVKEQESQIALLEEELLQMQNKLTSLEDRNRILSLTVSSEDVELNEQLMEEENDTVDLSPYNIILCGNDRHLKKYSYKILDYFAGPQRITMLDKADVIAIITTDIEHAAYWAIKSYCRTHGLKFCNINGNTPRIVESGLKNFVRENLL